MHREYGKHILLLLALASSPAGAYEEVAAASKDGRTVLTQGSLEVTISAKDGVSAARVRDGRRTELLSGGRTAVVTSDGKDLLAGLDGQSDITDLEDGVAKWRGKGASVDYRLPDGGRIQVLYALWSDQEGLLTIEVSFAAGKEPLRIREVRLLDARLTLGEGEVRVLANTKMWNTTVSVQDKEKVKSIFCSALYNRGARTGAVLGAMSARTASWVQTQQVDGAVHFQMVADYGPAETDLPGAGVCVIRPGQPRAGAARFAASTGPFVVGLPEDIHKGLESYGLAVNRYNGIKLHSPIPVGWCSWNAFGWIMYEKQMYETLETIKKHRLVEYGFNTFQIDDGWQCGWRCSGDWRPNPRRFPNGIKPIAEAVNSAGMDLGLWIGAFQDEDWDKSAGPDGSLKPGAPDWMKEAVPVLLNYPELMTVRGGKPTGKYDLSKPEFLKLLSDTERLLTTEWGARHVKADFLYGGDVQTDANLPAQDIYRNALRAIRAGQAPNTYLMTCVGYEWKALGITDGQRVGNDVSPSWQGFYPSARCAPGRYFLNGNFWWNDLDQLHVTGPVDGNGRPSVTLDQARAWATLFALYGGVTFTGDRLDKLPPERMRLLTQVMPSTGQTARPLDLFDVLSDRRPEVYCGIWDLKVRKPFGDYHVLGLFNWTKERPRNKTVRLEDLGLKPDDKLLVYDYWAEKIIHPGAAPAASAPASSAPASSAPVAREERASPRRDEPTSATSRPPVLRDGELEVEVPPTACRLLVIHRLRGEPMLISSDRHLTAGLVDVADAAYDAAQQTLRGRSACLVGGVPFRYAFYVPDGMKVTQAVFDGQPAELKMAGANLAIVTFSPSKARIQWSVKF